MAKLLTVPQVAAALDLSKDRVLRLIRAGRLPAKKLGPIWIIRPKDLKAFAVIPRKSGHPKKPTEGT